MTNTAGIRIEGLDDFQRELDRLQREMSNASGEMEVPFTELFTDSFMQEYTNYSSIDDLFEDGGFQAHTNEEFESISEEELDAHISRNTEFQTFQEMLGEASAQYVLRQLDF